MMKGCIYVITNDINNKQYVGKTNENIEKRFAEHLNDATKRITEKRPLYRAINKYGKEHFQIKVLEECDISILSEREIYWIEKLNTYKNGYNATIGGDGKQLYDYNIFIDEYKKGMPMRAIARKYKCDIDTVSNAVKSAQLDTRKNILNSNKIPVIQKTLNGEIIQKFESYADAGRYIKNTYPDINGKFKSIKELIRKAAIGLIETAYGFKWES